MIVLKKVLSCILVIFFTFTNISFSQNEEYENALTSCSGFLVKNITNPTVSSIGGEWMILGLARYNPDKYSDIFEKYYKNVCEYVKEKNGVLHNRKYTEYSRVVIALSAIGKDVTNVEGYNLLSPLGDYSKVVWQGLNGPIFALIALDTKNYEMPVCPTAQTQATRQMYIDYIINAQLENGGFSLNKKSDADVDITAMALQALSRYKNDEKVLNAINKALDYLSAVQNSAGGFSSQGNVNSESSAQVLCALSALNISVSDLRFVKNSNTVLNALMSFYIQNEGFSHLHNSANNIMATEQAFYALTAYMRNVNGKTALYDMSDVKTDDISASPLPGGLENKNKDVKPTSIIYKNKTFSDTQNNEYEKQISALASRGIINGKSENVFDPDATLTRAEFATLIVGALNLPVCENKIFDDVNESDWYYKYISTAFKYNIISGISVNLFNPNGSISRQEASAIITRCADLCGYDTSMEYVKTQMAISDFEDYKEISSWAQSAAAFCISHNIISDDRAQFKPHEAIHRDEAAYMIYTLLEISKLL